MSRPLADLIAIERDGHRSYGYHCECGVQYSNHRPTADHIAHIVEIRERRDYRAKVVAAHRPIDRGDGLVCSADGQPFPCEPLRSFAAESGGAW